MKTVSQVKACTGESNMLCEDYVSALVTLRWNVLRKLCAMVATLLILCFNLVAYSADRYEDKIAKVDGVEYYYMSVIRSGGSIDEGRCVLGRHSPQCAVNICDDRKKLCIPRYINRKEVIRIEAEACRHLVDVEEIVLPVGIRNIGSNTFRECWALKKINIPTTVQVIGRETFKDCESLENISMPANVEIGDGLFENCSSLKEFQFPKGVRVPRHFNKGIWNNGVPNEMFKGCSSLKAIVIPSDFTMIGAEAFYGCVSLSKIEMPLGLKTIGWGAFRECRSLETISLPESIVEIGDGAFNGCSGLKTITLPFRITKIQGGTVAKGGLFANCKNLTSIAIPENVEEIGMYAFLNCSSLETVSFSPDIEKIRVADAAFSGCRHLKEIILPRSIVDSVLDTKIDYIYNSKKLRELPGLKITYLD